MGAFMSDGQDTGQNDGQGGNLSDRQGGSQNDSLPNSRGEGHDRHAHAGHDDDGLDYLAAVSAYRRAFPDKAKELTPDPAVRAMLERFEELGLETALDRFDDQKPHCPFGLAGACCRNCVIGPCRISKGRPKGV